MSAAKLAVATRTLRLAVADDGRFAGNWNCCLAPPVLVVSMRFPAQKFSPLEPVTSRSTMYWTVLSALE